MHRWAVSGWARQTLLNFHAKACAPLASPCTRGRGTGELGCGFALPAFKYPVRRGVPWALGVYLPTRATSPRIRRCRAPRLLLSALDEASLGRTHQLRGFWLPLSGCRSLPRWVVTVLESSEGIGFRSGSSPGCDAVVSLYVRTRGSHMRIEIGRNCLAPLCRSCPESGVTPPAHPPAAKTTRKDTMLWRVARARVSRRTVVGWTYI